jgi:hypothetical protein
VVADTEIEAELGVRPERAGLDLVEIFDQIERPEPPPASSALCNSGTRTSS